MTLENLAALDMELREARLTMKKRIEEEFEKELAELAIRRDILAYKLREEGVPVTQISRIGLHTSATITAYKAIENGGRYYAPTDATGAAAPDRFTRAEGGDGIVFRPSVDELLAVANKIGFERDEDVPDEATFRVTDGVIQPLTERFVNGLMHPVVALVMADGSAAGRELIEFASK